MAKSGNLNLYGDTLLETTGTHGADIAMQRLDDLDKDALGYALTLRDGDGAAIDIGGGLGVQAVRFALLGLETTLIDLMDIDGRLNEVKRLLGLDGLKFLRKDARQLTPSDLPEKIRLAFSQRFIHYLTFQEADRLVNLISARMPSGARLFLSASGIESELGTNYPGSADPVERRYAHLAEGIAAKHGIHEQVCLYSREDLQTLVTRHGFTTDYAKTSPFGNIKGAFTRR